MSDNNFRVALELIRDFPVEDADNKDVLRLKFIADKALKIADKNLKEVGYVSDKEETDYEPFDKDRTMPNENYRSYNPKNDSTFERFKAVVVDHLGVNESKVIDSADFVDDLGADSLDLVELVMAIEEEFNVEIPDDEAELLHTVDKAIKFLKKTAA